MSEQSVLSGDDLVEHARVVDAAQRLQMLVMH
jgi:hypothetical protein